MARSNTVKVMNNKYGEKNVLQEQSLFTTIYLDENGTTVDMFVKLKKFDTQTDGKFTLVVFAEVETFTKNVTGRYIMIKFSEHKDLELEETHIIKQQLAQKQEIIEMLEE